MAVFYDVLYVAIQRFANFLSKRKMIHYTFVFSAWKARTVHWIRDNRKHKVGRRFKPNLVKLLF